MNDHVSNILHRIEQQIDTTETAIGGKLHLIDMDNDGYVTYDEIKQALALLKNQVGDEEFEQLL